MTSITTTTPSPGAALRRSTLVAFVAGASLATAVAVGLDATRSDPAPAPVEATTRVVTVERSPDSGCLVIEGRC